VFADREVWEFEYGRGMTGWETEAFLDRQMNLWAECGFGGCAVRNEHTPTSSASSDFPCPCSRTSFSQP
jgi:hypothetical protein